MPRTALANNRRSAPVRVTRRTPARPTLVAVPRTYTKDELLSRFAPLVRHVVERVAATLAVRHVSAAADRSGEGVSPHASRSSGTHGSVMRR